MRISTNYQYDTFQYDIQHASERLSALSQQMSSGKRINRPSDDPSGVGQTISMRQLQSGMQQYQSNLNTAKGQLGFVDSTAGDMTDMMNQAYQLAIQGATSATDQTGRN